MGTLGGNTSLGKGKICFFAGGSQTAQCNEEYAWRHFSDEQNLKFNYWWASHWVCKPAFGACPKPG